MTAPSIRLSRQLTVPLAILGRRIVFVADQGGGKTYAAKALVEAAHGHGVPFAVIDPTDKWWGLRSNADGTPGGLEGVTVFGGAHGDLPLHGNAAEAHAIADLVVDDGRSVVLVTSQMDDYGLAFVAAFVGRLNKRVSAVRRSVLLAIDEADEYAPLTVDKDHKAAFTEVDRSVRRLRADGLGVLLLTQRFQALHANVKEQADGLVVGRTRGSLGEAEVLKRVASKGTTAEATAIRDGLDKLAKGLAWWWLPEWEILAQTRVSAIRTYDSSATPEVGAAPMPEARRKPLDLGKLGERLAALADKAKDEDPAQLRARIRVLERDLAAAREGAPPAEPVEVPILHPLPLLDPELVARLEAATEPLSKVLCEASELLLRQRLELEGEALDRLVAGQDVPARGAVKRRVVVQEHRGQAIAVGSTPPPPPRAVRPPAPPAADELGGEGPPLKKGARRMLNVLGSMGGQPLSKPQLGTLAQVTAGGTFSNYLRSLVQAGLVVEGSDGVSLTDQGWVAVGEPPAPPTTADLVAMYGPRLKAGARRMLDILVANHPDGLTRTELGEQAEVTAGGTFSNYVRSLRTNGLAVERGGRVYAGEALYLAG